MGAGRDAAARSPTLTPHSLGFLRLLRAAHKSVLVRVPDNAAGEGSQDQSSASPESRQEYENRFFGNLTSILEKRIHDPRSHEAYADSRESSPSRTFEKPEPPDRQFDLLDGMSRYDGSCVA